MLGDRGRRPGRQPGRGPDPAARTRRESLNVSAALRHVIADLLGSVGVIVAAVIILTTGWEYADPVVSVADRRADPRPARGRSCATRCRSCSRARRRAPTSRRSAGRWPRCPASTQVHDLHVWTITSGFPGARRARARRPRHRLPRHAARARGDARTSASGSSTRRCRSTTRAASCCRSRTRREPAPATATSSPTIPAGIDSTRSGATCATAYWSPRRPARRRRSVDRGLALPRPLRAGRRAGRVRARGHRLGDLRLDRRRLRARAASRPRARRLDGRVAARAPAAPGAARDDARHRATPTASTSASGSCRDGRAADGPRASRAGASSTADAGARS